MAGRLIGIERSNDLRSRYAYDAAGRLQLLRHSYQHNTTLAEFDYTVDLLGDQTQITCERLESSRGLRQTSWHNPLAL